TYMQASTNQFMAMFATARSPSDTPGTMETPILIAAGLSTYTDFGGSPFRTGDYSATAVDPLTNTFWVANEYATAAATNNWGTWIANLSVFTASPSQLRALHPLRYIFDAKTQLSRGHITVLNRGPGAVPGPVIVAFPQLPPGVTLVNANGTLPFGSPFPGAPFITIRTGKLAARQAVRVPVVFQNPLNVPLSTFF